VVHTLTCVNHRGHVAGSTAYQHHAIPQCWGRKQGSVGPEGSPAAPLGSPGTRGHLPSWGLETEVRGDDSVFFFLVGFFFFGFFLFCFVFLSLHFLTFANTMVMRNAFARLPETRLWFWAVNVHTHTREQTTGDECFLSPPRPPLSVAPQIRL